MGGDKENEDFLYEMLLRIQMGDTESLEQLLSTFQPAGKSCANKAVPSGREDLEQLLWEKLTRAIYTYDVNALWDHTAYIPRSNSNPPPRTLP